MKLDIGCGSNCRLGFIPIDKKLGLSMEKLSYDDNSIDEIYASHVLEHASHAKILFILSEWHRVLKPDGDIRISVPDVVRAMNYDNWELLIMGGQMDRDDYHKSCFTFDSLKSKMASVGFGDLDLFVSDANDCSKHPCSINIKGKKKMIPVPSPGTPIIANQNPQKPPIQSIKTVALLSCPRLGFNTFWGETQLALSSFQIPIWQSQSAYWDHGIENLMELALKRGMDWIITLDYDSIISAKNVDELLVMLASSPEYDALCTIQRKRNNVTPLFSTGEAKMCKIPSCPMDILQGHFGLTIIRTDILKKMPKPWFQGVPGKNGRWSDDDRIDPDIYFWKNLRSVGGKVGLAPIVIGHMELMISDYAIVPGTDNHGHQQDTYVPRDLTVQEWNNNKKETEHV